MDKKLLILWVSLLIAGAIYFLCGNTHEALWFDESYTAAMVKHPLSEIWQLVGRYDKHPPLYYILLHLFVQIFGHSVFVLRSFSALGALCLAALGMGPIRRACGDRVGILFTWMVLVTPITLVYAQEARNYSWVAFFTMASLSYVYLAVRDEKRGDWIKWILFSIAAAYTHYYALLAITILHILLIAWLFAYRKENLKGYLITMGIIMICYLPWIIHLLRHTYETIQDYWIEKITFKDVLNTFIYPYSYQFSFPHQPLFSWIAYFMTFAFSLFGVIQSMIEKRTEAKITHLSFFVFILTIFMGVVASITIRPILIPRFMIPVLGLFLFSAAYGISRLSRTIWIYGVCILLLFLSIPQITQIQQQSFKGPMKEVSYYLEDRLKPEDSFLHTDIHTMGTFSFYFPHHQHFFFKPSSPRNIKDEIFIPNGSCGPDVNAFLKEHPMVWLTNRLGTKEFHIGESWIVEGKLKKMGDIKKFQPPFSWFGVQLVQLKLEFPL